jgi:hypothetical protein
MATVAVAVVVEIVAGGASISAGGDVVVVTL